MSISTPIVNGHANGVNGIHHTHEPAEVLDMSELEKELPMVQDDQIPLGELITRVAQATYAELVELAETLPNQSDQARKRKLADFVVTFKKQIVKLYAIVKWARDAPQVQKAMNITAFFLNQSRQFDDAIQALDDASDQLTPARLRNHDLLTALDVLATGSYQRLPTAIRKYVIAEKSLTPVDAHSIMRRAEDLMRYRLRMRELIPIEMHQYRVQKGRVTFTVPNMFRASLFLQGNRPEDGWEFAHLRFLFGFDESTVANQVFPLEPKDLLRHYIVTEATARLQHFLEPPQIEGMEQPPDRPKLTAYQVDTPLIRLFNFLQMLSLSYQLEILLNQARNLRSLGWAEQHYSVQLGKPNEADARGREAFTVSYWRREPPTRRISAKAFPPFPQIGGKLCIYIDSSPPSSSIGLQNVLTDAINFELQQTAKIGDKRPSDAVEKLSLKVKWLPEDNALGIRLVDDAFVGYEIQIDPQSLHFETILMTAIKRHVEALMRAIHHHLKSGPFASMFSASDDVLPNEGNDEATIRIRLSAEQFVVVGINPRSARLILRDTGDLACTNLAPQFDVFSIQINEVPPFLFEALANLKLTTILDHAERKADYLGLRSFRARKFGKSELAKFGEGARGALYIQLLNFPNYYLVLVVTESAFRFALISVREEFVGHQSHLIIADIGWLDLAHIRRHQISIASMDDPAAQLADDRLGLPGLSAGDSLELSSQWATQTSGENRFKLDSQSIRLLYAFCCARVSHTKIEEQLRLRGFSYAPVMPSGDEPYDTHTYLRSSIARTLPVICVEAAVILAGVPAADAAMPNIKIVPLYWWQERKSQVIISVKLKYVQEPVGKRAASSIIRPSKSIIYDAREAVVSFLSDNIETCLDEFIEGWTRVAKMVLIAREVARMASTHSWPDVRLLSFDLQTIQFTYFEDYTLSLSCTDQLLESSGSYNLVFRRLPSKSLLGEGDDHFNPHEESETFLRNILRSSQLSVSVLELVTLLRETLPIVVELDEIAKRDNLSVVVKGVGWYRLLYGDTRHALDFRLLNDGQLFIADSSCPITESSPDPVSGQDRSPAPKNLLAIPYMDSIMEETASDDPSIILLPPTGMICKVSEARHFVQITHEKVRERLNS